jgi:hypothetical protein
MPIIPTSKLVLLGRRLVGDDTEVVVSGRKTKIEPQATDARLIANLPPDLVAGVQAVQVTHKLAMGDPPPGKPHPAFESNVAAFVLHPTFASLKLELTLNGKGLSKGKATVIDVKPPVGRAQRVMLMLNPKATTATARAYAFVASPRELDTDPIVVPMEGVASGDYFVRVQVDGAESAVDLSAGTPAVKI